MATLTPISRTEVSFYVPVVAAFGADRVELLEDTCHGNNLTNEFDDDGEGEEI